MKNQKHITFLLASMLFTGCLSGCEAMTVPSNHALLGEGSGTSAVSEEESLAMEDTAYAMENTAYAIEEDSACEEAALRENLKLYEEFGMTYDSSKEEAWYNGKLVRWFEDYYPVDDVGQGGVDFYNEDGVVDVYAVRDFNNIEKHADGSFDPSGKVIALKEFSDEEFAARDVDAIKNPEISEVSEGEPLTAQEIEEMAEEYVSFGVTYDVSAGQWYLNGEKVRYFLDILTSNGEALNSGNFQGTIRSEWSDEGTVDIYTVRDFSKLNDDGVGSLVAVKKYNQQEFDERVKSNGEKLERV